MVGECDAAYFHIVFGRDADFGMSHDAIEPRTNSARPWLKMAS
jgi:hypothetical protein